MNKLKQYKEINNIFWPIAISMFLSSILSFIDSAMISNYNILGVSAINIASQVMFVFGPIFFAITIGINIFTVQYYATGKYDDLKKLIGVALIFLLPFLIIGLFILTFFSNQIISMFTPIDSEVGVLAASYLVLFKYNLILSPIEMIFMHQYRAIKKPKIPLIMSTLQALLNIVLNLFLIFGLFGAPELGIYGAALATLISRVTFILINYFYARKIRAPFLNTFKEMFSFDKKMVKDVYLATYPLVLVEFGFGFARVIYTKIFVLTGVISFAAYNVAKLISFLINSLVIATASVSGIMMGSAISRDYDLKKESRTLFEFMLICSVLIMILSIFILPNFMFMFNVEDDMKLTVFWIIVANGIYMSIRVFVSSIISILKAGGDNKFVIIVDAGMSYLVGVPVLIIGYYLGFGIIGLNFLLIFEMIAKLLMGVYRYKKGIWKKKL